MSEDAMGDEVYQPNDSDTRDNPDDIDLDNALDEKRLDETLDEGYSPPEKPLAVSRHGTTAREQHERESLEQRLAEEVPEVGEPEGNGIGDQPGMAGEPVTDRTAGERRAGRLVEGDDESFPPRGSDIIGRDVGIDGGAASAEEAAVHVTEGEAGEPETEEDRRPPGGDEGGGGEAAE